MSKGFTLIELAVTIVIIAILSAVVLFSTTQYLNVGKDNNLSGNLAVLIPAGETYYGISQSYAGFCSKASGSSTGSTVMINTYSQMAKQAENITCPTGDFPGLCCNVAQNGDSWVACAQKFTDNTKADCVDSRGIKKEILVGQCSPSICNCDLSSCQ